MTQAISMRRSAALAAMLALALMTSACNRPQHDGHAAHAEAAAPDEEAPQAITHFSDKAELFVEFVRLAAGRESVFAAHMTTLADFKPVTAGSMTVTLSGGNQPDETFSIEAPARPGIFRPAVTPRHAGQRKLVVRLQAPGLVSVHDLGTVMVYAGKAAALKAQAAEPDEAPGSISYLKEQQWVTDYALAQAEKRSLRTSVAATGTLRAPASHDAQLTAVAAGQVLAAGGFPRVGSRVKQGEVLAHLVPRLGGEADFATLDVAAQKARIAFQSATRERERLEALYKQEAVPERRVIAARSEERLAKAELSGAERRAGMYRQGTAASGGIAVRAPIAGTIAAVSVAPGGYINEGQPLLHIVDASRLWLELRVAETDLGRIGQPDAASFTVEGFDGAFDVSTRSGARVVGFGNVIDPVSRTTPLTFEFPNPDQRLRIGAAVRASIYAGNAAAVIAVPASALVDDNGQSVVYVQRGGEAFERRAVQTGMRDGDWVEIRSGIGAGERVVSKGAYQVRLASTGSGAGGEGHVH